MKEELPEILDRNDLQRLEDKNRVIYFNYLGNIPKINEKNLLRILKGKSHALVDKHLYVTYGSFAYRLQIKDWVETDEGEKYKPLLEKICSSR